MVLLLLLMMMMILVDSVIVQMMVLIRMTFITVADDTDGVVAVDNGDQLVICLFSNLFIIIIL